MGQRKTSRRRAGYALLAAGAVYCAAWAGVNFFAVHGVDREPVRLAGPGGKPCLGTLWTCGTPNAVVVMGHGITSNQGVMASAAHLFARNGYAVATLDFWGHGRSRETFDWSSNAGVATAWCDWARTRFAGLPLAYLGHSMGGAAGMQAFASGLNADAFVSMGMLSRQIPACPTLIAMGRYEELFSVEEARRAVAGKGEVLVSPFSEHSLEAVDPVLLTGILAWLNKTLGVDGGPVTISWIRWALPLLAVLAGTGAALALAECAAVLLSPARRADPPPSPAGRPGRFNPFRPAAWVVGCTGLAVPPQSGSFVSAGLRGLAFAGVFILLLSWLLTPYVYVCGLFHPERCLLWMGLIPIMSALFLLTSRAMERHSLQSAFQRFAVGALTRSTPLVLLCVALMLRGPGIAFLGMVLGILGLVFALVSGVYALAVRGAGDYRAGAVASGAVLAWITAFCLPMTWL